MGCKISMCLVLVHVFIMTYMMGHVLVTVSAHPNTINHFSLNNTTKAYAAGRPTLAHISRDLVLAPGEDLSKL